MSILGIFSSKEQKENYGIARCRIGFVWGNRCDIDDGSPSHCTHLSLVGIVAAALSVCMYGAPLSIMKLVVETKSVEYMPFFLSLFVFLCSLSWFVYGILGRDVFVGVPNGVGTVLGVAQLVLYWIYKDSTPTKSVDFSVDTERLLQQS